MCRVELRRLQDPVQTIKRSGRGAPERIEIAGQDKQRQVPRPTHQPEDETCRKRVPPLLQSIEQIPAPADLFRQRPMIMPVRQ